MANERARALGFDFITDDKYLRSPFKAPVQGGGEDASTESFGIPYTNAFTGSGGGSGSGGNAFGYGSQIEPGGSFGSYGTPNYTGGLPGNVQQYGVGRQFEDASASPIGETYSYKKTVPAWARTAAAFVPGGNFGLNFLEKKMNQNRDQPPGRYAIGGLDQNMKGLYDNLAGEQMLFDGPGGVKTLTGKNFTGKGYLEGQIDIAKGFGFDTMSDEDIEKSIAASKNNKRKQFEYKQKIEAWNTYKTNKAQTDYAEKEAEKVKAAEEKARSAKESEIVARKGQAYYDRAVETAGGRDPSQGNTVTGYGTSGLGRNPEDKMAKGGRAGYFFGGRAGFAEGGWSPGVGRDEKGYQSDHGSYTGDNNNTTAPTTTFFNNPEIIKEETMFGNVPAGLGFNNDLGKYKAVMDLRNSIKNQSVEGEIEYNNTIGDFDFGGKYDTQDGATYGASYNKNGLGVNYNNIDGTSASYNKGPFSISTDGDNTTAGVKWTFKNGGLASIL